MTKKKIKKKKKNIMTIIMQLGNFLNNQDIKITGFIIGEVVIKWRNVPYLILTRI